MHWHALGIKNAIKKKLVEKNNTKHEHKKNCCEHNLKLKASKCQTFSPFLRHPSDTFPLQAHAIQEHAAVLFSFSSYQKH